jgi:D-amino peptidase
VKILMLTDMEGVAGVVSFTEQAYNDGKYYEQAKKLETGEVNAAVAGLLEAGVTEVLVWDWHGPGGISYEDLHPAAKLLHGRPHAPMSRVGPVLTRYDAAVVIGQHAMHGLASATLNHSQSSEAIDYYKFNGQTVGEIALDALYCGSWGLPMIFLSGDVDACKEAEATLPGITTVAVKEGLSKYCAISLTAPEARRRIREGSYEAVKSHVANPLQPYTLPGPYVIEKRYFFTDAADLAAAQPGVERIDDQTVRRTSPDLRDIVYW